jgi:hypothetical protein
LVVLASWLMAAEPGLARNGVFGGTDATAVPKGLALYGTYVGGDEFTGKGESPWRPAQAVIVLYIAGYPGQPGEELRVEWRNAAGAITTTRYRQDPPREKWQAWRVAAPAGSVDVRWVAEDRSAAVAGWLGVSDFVETRGQLKYAPVRTQALVVFGVLALLVGLFGAAVAGRVRRALAGALGEEIAGALTPIVATGLLALAGYGAFWAWFVSVKLGLVVSGTILGASVAGGAYEFRRLRGRGELLVPWALAVGVGVFYLGLLLTPEPRSLAQAAANRFAAKMPADNELPGIFAQRLIDGQEPKHFLGDWLGSDRPPLQTGWDLVFWPPLKGLDVEPGVAHGIAGMWLQLAWVPCGWAVFQLLGLKRWQSAGATLAMGTLGLVLVNSVYVWPKLSAAAFTLVGGLMCLQASRRAAGREGGARVYSVYGLGGLLLVLGWLSHGASAFALIGLGPLVRWDWRNWKGWAVAGAVFGVLGSGWVCYQKFYDPPGNRLLKWHLAGVVPLDERGVVETLVAQYKKVGWDGALSARRVNLAMQKDGDWAHLLEFTTTPVRRYCELTFYPRSAGLLLPLGVLAWVGLAVSRRHRTGVELGVAAQLLAWMLATWVAWLALMFLPSSTLGHQGTYVLPMILYALLLTGIFRVLGRFAPVLVAVQLAYLLAVWGPLEEYYRATLPEAATTIEPRREAAQ